MSTKTGTTGLTAEAETATKTATTEAREVPTRDEVLRHFAREAQGLPEEPAAAAPPADAPPATAETENASEALSQTESESAATAEPSEPDHLDDELKTAIAPEVQERINRRIGKEVAKTKAEREAREALETRLAELEAKVTAAGNAEPAVRVGDKLGHVNDLGTLEAERVRAQDAIEQAEDLMATLEDDPGSVQAALRAAKIELKDEQGQDDYSETRMRRFLRSVRLNADRTLRRAIPDRQRFIEKASGYSSQAQEWMPELKDAKSERTKLYNLVLQRNPGLKQQEEWPLMAMVAVLGVERFNELQAAKAKPEPKAKRELPVVIPAPRAQPPAVKGAPQEDFTATADKILSGDKSLRRKFIQTLVPK